MSKTISNEKIKTALLFEDLSHNASKASGVKNKITLKKIASAAKKKTGVSYKIIYALLVASRSAVIEYLADGHSIYISGFGTIKIKPLKKRQYLNPKDKKMCWRKHTTSLRLNPCRSLLEKLNSQKTNEN